MKTMKTWKNFTGNTGAAITTWNYHTQRGWLSSKRYPSPATGFASTTGTDYDYWPSGRLKKRTWARGNPRLDTSYAYNDAGDLATVTYSDGTTPNVTHTYDRRGRQQTVARDGMTTTLSHNLAGQLTGEVYAGGLLNGWALTNRYDTLLRRWYRDARLNGGAATTTY